METTDDTARERLEQERQLLQGEIAGMDDENSEGMEPDNETGMYGNHMADVGTETFEKEKNLALESNLQRQLEDTGRALERLEQGHYGICTNCGKPIDPERLEAMPQAELCIDCKRKQEGG